MLDEINDLKRKDFGRRMSEMASDILIEKQYGKKEFYGDDEFTLSAEEEKIISNLNEELIAHISNNAPKFSLLEFRNSCFFFYDQLIILPSYKLEYSTYKYKDILFAGVLSKCNIHGFPEEDIIICIEEDNTGEIYNVAFSFFNINSEILVEMINQIVFLTKGLNSNAEKESYFEMLYERIDDDDSKVWCHELVRPYLKDTEKYDDEIKLHYMRFCQEVDKHLKKEEKESNLFNKKRSKMMCNLYCQQYIYNLKKICALQEKAYYYCLAGMFGEKIEPLFDADKDEILSNYLRCIKLYENGDTSDLSFDDVRYVYKRLGDFYKDGFGTKATVDKRKAFNYYLEADSLDRDNEDREEYPDVKYFIGISLKEGLVVERNVDAAEKYFEDAAIYDYGLAEYELFKINLEKGSTDLAESFREKAKRHGTRDEKRYKQGKAFNKIAERIGEIGTILGAIGVGGSAVIEMIKSISDIKSDHTKK